MADEEMIVNKYCWLAAWATLFLSWGALEIMERKGGMAPMIITSNELFKHAEAHHNPLKKVVTNKRMTKSLDAKGKFRIQIRGTIYFIKTVWIVWINLFSTIAFIAGGDWFPNHFIWLKSSSMNYWPFQHVTASIVVFYPWEIAANRYGKLDWSTIIHHYVASLAALWLLLGRYNPYATWYGYSGISLSWPVFFALGWRTQYGNRFPNITKKFLIYAKWHYLAVCVINFSGMGFLFFNCLVWHPGVIPLSVTITTMFAVVAWVYDDYHLYCSLHSMSKMDYAEADVLTRRFDTERIHPKQLFGRSVLNDLFPSDDDHTVDPIPKENRMNTITKHTVRMDHDNTDHTNKDEKGMSLRKMESINAKEDILSDTEMKSESDVINKTETDIADALYDATNFTD
eukprot:209126_1